MKAAKATSFAAAGEKLGINASTIKRWSDAEDEEQEPAPKPRKKAANVEVSTDLAPPTNGHAAKRALPSRAEIEDDLDKRMRKLIVSNGVLGVAESLQRVADSLLPEGD